MQKRILGTTTVTQVAIVVRDIEKAAQAYADFLGVEKPPTVTTDAIEKSRARYKGNPTRARAKLAFFTVGPGLELELIQPDNEPSTWREDLDRNGEGVHHIAFQIKGMKETLARLTTEEMPLIQAGEYTGGRYAYVDARRDLKVVIELLETD
jgi:catechol 2,3-dioxygenase-like lactoylglutathione lyase family enzyme